MSNAVFCIAPSEDIAHNIVARLKHTGFSDNDISVLFPDESGSRDVAQEQNTKAPEDADANGGVDGMSGLLAGIDMLGTRPIMAAPSGTAVGATTDGIMGELIGMGLSEAEARRYESKIKGANVLISARTDESDKMADAKAIFASEHATDISMGSRAGDPASKVPDARPDDPHGQA